MPTAIVFLNNVFNIYLRNITFSAKDFFDILIIAFLIYVITRFLLQTHSIFLVFGVFVLIVIYGVSLVFDLSLTSFILKSFTGIFLLILVIIFQREIRSFFSLIGFLGIKKQLIPVTENKLEIITQSIGHLAKEKTGAIIIFPGLEPIEKHLESGYFLNGVISEPLILSIFDDTSPGHDGAMVIKNNKILKFGVHLPLAEHIEKVKGFGLRHRAALGLSERSDAFIVIISEERGEIRVAEKGRLYRLKDEFELRDKLLDFLNRKFPKEKYFKLGNWITKNFIFLIVSFVISFGLFISINPQFATVQRNFVVPIEFKNVPQNLVVDHVVPQEMTLTLQAKKSDFSTLDVSALKVVVDIGLLKNISGSGWHSVLISSKNIELPFKLIVIKIESSNIRFLVSEK